MKFLAEFEQCAASLYDGGWREKDRDQMMDYYDMTEDEADKVSEMLGEIERGEWG